MKLLLVSGSLRRESYNRRLLLDAARLVPGGVEVELWHGLETVPPYSEDDDGPAAPETAVRLRERLRLPCPTSRSTPTSPP